MSTRIIRILGLILSSIVLWIDQGYSGLPAGTLVATRCGLMPIEKLKRGDKVLSYDLNETNPDEIIVEVAITNISKHVADSVFTLCTAEGGFIDASPQQLFFTLTAKSNQSDEPLIMDFVQAQQITTGYMLIDEYMNCIPIVETTKIELSCTYPKQYSEVIQRDRHNKITSIERRIVKVDIYSIEVEAPHTFLVSDRTYYKGKPRLLLTHNGIPALGAGLSLVFGSTPASLSFAEATASVGGLGVAFGPVGVAIGVVTGLGLLGYQFFKSQDKSQNSFYIERADSCGNGGRDPKDPKDDEKKRDEIPIIT